MPACKSDISENRERKKKQKESPVKVVYPSGTSSKNQKVPEFQLGKVLPTCCISIKVCLPTVFKSLLAPVQAHVMPVQSAYMTWTKLETHGPLSGKLIGCGFT